MGAAVEVDGEAEVPARAQAAAVGAGQGQDGVDSVVHSTKHGDFEAASPTPAGPLARRGEVLAVARAGGRGGGGLVSKSGAAGSFSSSSAMLCAIAIQELDDQAIELIFTFLPAEDRRSAAAVCRLWRRVHNSSTKLWGSVLLSGERIVQAAASSTAAGSVVSWLAARMEAMRNVRLWSPYPLEAWATGLAQLLSRENRLQSFSYVCTDVSVSRLLGELQGLTSLQLLDILSPSVPGQGLVMRARELAKLKPLRNLLSLQLHALEIKGALPPALFRCLNRLQHLAISAKCRLPAGVVKQLSGLQSLELHSVNMDAEAAEEAATSLQQLTRLCISVRGLDQLQEQLEGEQEAGHGQRGGGSDSSKGRGGSGVQRWQDHPIWGQLPALAQLQQLAVAAELPSGGGQEAAILPFDALGGSVPDGIMDCSSLTHLALPVALTALPDMVPGQLPRLIELDLTHSIVEALLPSWCCNLQSLQRLVLNGAQLAGGDLPPEFAALQSLRHLELRACRLQALPQCVAALTGLTHLDLGINCLTDLPDGPYLGQLQHLVLRNNALRALPPALVGAEQLQCLDAGENDELVLQCSDVDGLLAHMPSLRQLVLSRQPAGLGFGPYISAGTGAAWDAQSVAALMQLARSLPDIHVQLERSEPPGMPPAAAPGGAPS